MKVFDTINIICSVLQTKKYWGTWVTSVGWHYIFSNSHHEGASPGSPAAQRSRQRWWGPRGLWPGSLWTAQRSGGEWSWGPHRPTEERFRGRKPGWTRPASPPSELWPVGEQTARSMRNQEQYAQTARKRRKWRGWRAEEVATEIKLRKSWISLEDSEVRDRKFRKQFHLWLRHCGSADLHWLQYNVISFHLTCVRTSPKSFHLRWTPNYNAQFPKARFLSARRVSAHFLLIPTSARQESESEKKKGTRGNLFYFTVHGCGSIYKSSE